MSEPPTVTRALTPLLVLALLVGAILSTPAPSSQLKWFGVGAVLAVVGAVWFARVGYRQLDATVSDLWLFSLLAFSLVFLAMVVLPEPTFEPLEGALVAAVTAIVAGGIAFSAVGAPVRRLLWGETESR
ncbi:hypothetical protein [Haloarchaeobius sp. TZWWS8]|uniref:hypothetical protein n=1 Tax=Haloarchaeobius sp. TZWWS8 TaxID=3446121 RepID=UPI003EB69A4A